MFGKRTGGPEVKPGAPPQTDTATKQAENGAPAEAMAPPSAPAPTPAPTAAPKPREASPPAPDHSDLFGDERDRYNETKQSIFTSLIEAVDLTELGKLELSQVREEITDIVGEIIAMKVMVLSSTEQQSLITDICNDVHWNGTILPTSWSMAPTKFTSKLTGRSN